MLHPQNIPECPDRNILGVFNLWPPQPSPNLEKAVDNGESQVDIMAKGIELNRHIIWDSGI